MIDLIGQTLKGRYRIDALLGRGGMAEVYKAWDTWRNYYVAVKMMREDLAEDLEFVQRFQREAQALAALDHQHIVRFYSFERDDLLTFIVMDYIEGTTLRSEIARAAGPLPLPRVMSVVEHICAALHYAHLVGVLHRDIKPGNIMIEPDGRALVADFGIAKAADAATATTVMPGTPAYMSPEQCRSEPLDARTDVYSLGIVAYEMLAGRRPFSGETADSGTGSTRDRIRWEQMHAAPPPLRVLNPEVSVRLEAVVRKALAKDREARWPTVLDFWQALEAALPAKPGERAAQPAAADRAAAPDKAAAPRPILSAAPAVAGPQPSPAAEPLAEVRPEMPAYHTPRRAGLPAWAWALGGVLLAGMVILALALGGGGGGGAGPAAAPVARATATTTVRLVPTRTLPPTAVSKIPSPQAIETLQITRASTSSPSPSPTPSQPVYTGIFLELVFTDTSWIQVTVDGVRQFQGELEASTYRSWYGEEKIELRVGNAGGVQITINGQKLGTLGGPGVVADRIFEKVGEEVAAATPTLAAPSLGDTWTRPADGMEMVYVPAGKFLMGSADTDPHASGNEKPQHTVYLDAFWIDRTEVTNAQYRECVEAGACRAPTTCDWGEPTYDNASKADHPAVCVSWEDARSYCEWAGARLPTEAEWEKAARGTDGGIYPWGDSLDGNKLNFCDRNCEFDWKDTGVDDGYALTAPVGSYPSGASPYGALDMAGNVREWVADWWDEGYYGRSPAENPPGPASGVFRGLRGGSWFNYSNWARSANRGGSNPVNWFINFGFRCSVSPTSSP